MLLFAAASDVSLLAASIGDDESGGLDGGRSGVLGSPFGLPLIAVTDGSPFIAETALGFWLCSEVTGMSLGIGGICPEEFPFATECTGDALAEESPFASDVV